MKQMVFKTIFVLAMALMSLQANAQVKEFEKYADTKNVTYVFISKFMLRMAGKAKTPSVPGVDTKSLMNKLTGIQIITSENEAASARLKSDVQSIVKQGKYERAYQIIDRLYKQHPQKSAFYVDQLRFLEKLMLNEKKRK